MRNDYLPFIVTTLLFMVEVQAATKEQVKLLLVSRNHFKTDEDSRYECHLSYPDTDAIVDTVLKYYNEEWRISSDLSTVPVYDSTGGYAFFKVDVPGKRQTESSEIFSCIAFKPGKQKTVVLSHKMRSDALIVPRNGLFTQTVSVGDSDVSISMKRRDKSHGAGLRWKVNGQPLSRYDDNEVFSFPNKIAYDHRGLYECHVETINTEDGFDIKEWESHGLQSLIVRACPAKSWGPPECIFVCDICYNGGICDENTGSCVCPPGFKGEDCAIACGGNRFGYDCEKMCNITVDEPHQCRGLLFCLNHPFGCRCNTGWTGLECETPCEAFTYGANCLQRCNCSAHEHCSRYMGCKALPKLTSAPSVVRKGNSSVTITWIQWNETKDIGDPPVIGYIPYYKEKASTLWIQGAFLSGDSRQFTATNLSAEISYSLSVSAVREDGGEGPKGPLLEVETFCDTPNIKPTSLRSVVQGYHQETVNVSWEVPSLGKINCKTGIELFTIYVASTAGVRSVTVNDPSARSFNVEGLVPGKFYRFEMTLSTTGGESFLSEENDMSTIFLPVLPRLSDAPFFLNVTTQSVTVGWLEWNSLTDVGTPFIVAYKPYFKPSNSSKWMNGSLVLFHNVYEYTFKGLHSGELYDFSVAAIRNGVGGEGQKSPLAKIKVPPKDFCEPSESGQGSFPSAAIVMSVFVFTFLWWKNAGNDQQLQPGAETFNAGITGSNEGDGRPKTYSKKDKGTSTEDLSEMCDTYKELKEQTLLKMNEEKQMAQGFTKNGKENREKEKEDEDKIED